MAINHTSNIATSKDLRNHLLSIDKKGYPAYKALKGKYNFGDYILFIDHVQGDPFASPSRLSVVVSSRVANFPEDYYDTTQKRITLQDYVTRLFSRQLHTYSKQAKGSGKSGLLTVSHCGQQILERTACRIESGNIILRFEAGFPARGRTIDAKELEKMLFTLLPSCIQKSLIYNNIDKNRLTKAIQLCEDQQYIREQLKSLNLCAFVANGSILPRENGSSDLPLKNAIAFQSPPSLELTLSLPNQGSVKGMAIPRGITLFVGGGYHGKSTILQALQNAVYNHIPGDGRELVITDDTALKLRAEDGRSISNVDISPFIRHLPGKKDTVNFSTQDASGSTSQAASLMEAIEGGSRLLLIDEDTSATNFMIRDSLMQAVVSPEEEPIIPFIQRVKSLYKDCGISSLIVAGSSGSYFHVADHIIQMKEYIPYDITEKARKIARQFEAVIPASDNFPTFSKIRKPKNNESLRKAEKIKIKASGTQELSLNYDSIELRYLEQLTDREQTMALGYILKYLELHILDGTKTMTELLKLIEKHIDEKGLEGLFHHGDIRDSLARPRSMEIAGCINRYRNLHF